MTVYRINSPNVVAETIDNESVVINLDKGTYYSIRATGSELWEALRAGVPHDLLLDKVAVLGGATAVSEVRVFIDQLLSESLIVPDEVAQAGSVEVGLAGQYASPELVKYSDMEALLLLDPIHDVDEAGWPLPA